MRLGLFGGTFDPPHIGHLIAAQDAHARLALDRTMFIPAAIPPHKRGLAITPADIRIAMLRAAIGDDARFEIDDQELRRDGPSYTVDTLRAYRQRWPDATLFLLIGADQWADFDSWREPDEILRLARIAVLTREGAGAPNPSTTEVPVTRIDVTSTALRDRVRAGAPIRYLVTPAVEAIIRERQLYGGAA